MFKNMKIGKKLIISFIAVAIIASASGIISIFTTNNIDSNYSNALTNFGFAQGDIGKAMLMITDGRRAVRDIVSCTNQKYIDAAKADLADVGEKYNTYAAAVEPTLTTDETKALYATAVAAIDKYRIKRDEVIKLGDTTDPEQSAKAREVMMEELDPLYDDVYNAWSEIMTYKVTYGQKQSNDLTAQTGVTVIINIALVCAALLVAVLLGVFVSRSISNPVKACSKRLEQLADGDLHTDVPKSNSKDEVGVMLHSLEDTASFINAIIGDLGHGLGEMAKGNLTVTPTVEFKGDFAMIEKSMELILTSLNSTLGQINQASEQVSAGSDQVSSGAQALSQGATEQASSVEELAATITEISSQIKGNATSSQKASKEAEQAGFEMVESNKKMQALIEAMGEISNSSQQISRVIKTIEDIAFQTNILALNAAVEAARAGTAGKGFAVVADEVRNLASKSAEAAKSTTELIEGSILAVENGTTLANDTAKSFDVVVGNATTVSEIVSEISKASTEQANSIAQVTQGIDQISAVVQTNSATAEESAAASEELSGQAAMLKQLVGKFQLTNTSDAVALNPAPAREPVTTQHTVSAEKY
ncbi:MAG: methyl-accepting chemotaxis protein [Hydrogenoanaerobacterium sp.]